MPSKRKRNRRRRRNKKNYNNTANPQQFAKDKEKFHKARLEAQREHEEAIQIETELNQSKALQRAQAEKDEECTAYVTNLPFKTSAMEIVNWLTNTHLISMRRNTTSISSLVRRSSRTAQSQSIISCEIIKHSKGKHKGTSSGKAYVQFSSKDAFQHIQNLSQTSGLVLQGRRINFVKGYRQENHRDQRTTNSFNVSKVQVGHSVHLDSRSRPSSSEVKVHWQSPEASSFLSLGFNGRVKRALSIQAADTFRLDFELRHISQLRIGVDKNRKRIVIMQLRIPPYCFRAKAIAASGTASLQERFMHMTFGDLMDTSTHDDIYYWSLDPDDTITRQQEYEWIRTIDPTGGSIFNRYRTYRLIFDHGIHSSDDQSLLQCFRDFAVKPTPDSSKFIFSSELSYSPGSSNKPEDDWCGGFPSELSGLDFSTRYLLHVMLSESLLILPTSAVAGSLGQTFRNTDTDIVNSILEYFLASRIATCCEQLIHDIQLQISQRSELHNGKAKSSITVDQHYNEIRTQEEDDDDDDLQDMMTQRCLVTPTRCCPQVPAMEQSNRILRKFHRHSNRFLRISFVDENFGFILQALSDDIVEQRLRRLMLHGLFVGGEKFVFLHYSSSQLREQSCWFYNESKTTGGRDDPPPSADDIRQFMGQSDCRSIRVIGKHASRMGQGFSTSVPTVRIQPEMNRKIGDVKRNGFCFSDGIGYISSSLAKEVADKMDFDEDDAPSAYQVRIGGAKGVVSVFDRTAGDKHIPCLTLRPSMIKYNSQNSLDLEVLSYSKPMRCYLNRQIITILSCLGIADNVFQSRLDDMIHILSNCLTSTKEALKFALHSVDEDSMVYRALQSGFDITRDRHLRGILQAQRNRFMLDLELKARIYIPQGVNLIGILDETNALPYGTVFFQFNDPVTKELKTLPHGTRVAVYRSPCIHPGDVRVLTVVDFPILRQWVNVIVFPQQGERPHPDEMSGGDLDGDIYSVIYDTDLVPSKQHDAMPQASISSFDAPKTTTTNIVSTNEIANFFVDYIQNDNLGRIANAHCVLADFLDDGALSDQCLQLAELHSTAVDFAKTGIPAQFPRNLVPKKYPDFMQNMLKESYESSKVLGKMYRVIKDVTYTDLTDIPDGIVDKILVLPRSEQYHEEAQVIYSQYSQDLWEIMRRYGVDDEQSLLSGFVRDFSSKLLNSRTRNGKVQDRLNRELSHLRQEYRDIFWLGLDEVDETNNEYNAMAKASSWYQVAYKEGGEKYLSQGRTNEPRRLISFPWLMHELLCKIKVLNMHNS